MQTKTTFIVAVATVGVLLLASNGNAAEPLANFAQKAASGGQMEVDLGKYAAANAASPAVRAFGSRMVTDHSKANAELATVAAKAGMPLSTQLSSEQADMVATMTKLKGAELDKAYMDAMVDDHEKVIAEFKEAAAERGPIGGWAAKTLPTLEEHLAQAKSIDKQVKTEAPSVTH